MSRYTNYEMKNNVFGTLSAPISSLATTIQLSDGQGARFTADMLGTLETIEAGKVTKREIVKITNVSGDTLTVIRKYAPCPSSDDANTQGQVSYSFSADDTISVYISKEHFDKLYGSINDIYDNGTNKLRTEVVSGLQIKVNPGSVLVGSAYYYFAGDTITLTDNATNYVEIDEDGLLVSNTTDWGDKYTKIAKVITSSGTVISIEDWRLGTVGGEIGGVNIHDLTGKEILSPDDEFIIADSENIRQNKKIKLGKFIGYQNIISGETLSGGDIVAIKNYNKKAETTLAVGNLTSNQKLAVKIFGSGKSFIDLYVPLGIVNDGQNVNIRIETNNSGEPSGILANANSYTTISTSDLTTTVANIKCTLNGETTLTYGEIYWLVISTDTVNATNYCIIGASNTMELQNYYYDGNRRTPYTVGTAQSATLKRSAGQNTHSNINTYTYTIVFNKDIILTSFGLGTSIVIKQGDTTLYSGGNTSINIGLLQGITYTIIASGVGGINMNAYNSTISCSICSSVSALPNAPYDNITIGYAELINITNNVCCASVGMSDFIKKVDTTKIETFSDLIGIVNKDCTEGDNVGFVSDSGIIENDSRVLIPGQDCYYENNAITDTPTANTNIVYLGKAINNTTIKINIKKAIYNLSSDIAPFTGLNSGVPVYKGETVTGSLIAGF